MEHHRFNRLFSQYLYLYFCQAGKPLQSNGAITTGVHIVAAANPNGMKLTAELLLD
jgi:hypothetical protein